MTHNGWRKPTPGLVVAEKHAQAGEGLSIPKSQATVATKKVAAAIGLKAPDLLLLDTLAAFTQSQDWEQGRRPIVWASNNYLIEQTGFSLSALRRHIRRLAELGLIWIKDSPNGKRYGYRDEDGVIVEAFGFDLAPLAARTAEFEALYVRIKEEREFCASMRNVVTVTRRIIRAKIEKALESNLRGPWRELKEEFAELLLALPTRSTAPNKLLDIVDWFKAFKQRVEQAFEAAFDWPEASDEKSPSQEADIASNIVRFNKKMIPRGVADDTHILITNQPNPVSSNSFEKQAAESFEPEKQQPVRAERPEKVDLDIQWSSHTNKRTSQVDIGMLMLSCPRFGALARGTEGYIRDWNDLHRAAGKIRGMAGISEHAWNAAQKVLGAQIAAAAIALVYDKYETGEVKSPGGYLRGMIEKAQKGELHLDRSFYGRLSEAGTH
ncbi:plasmid replication protein RepC [Ahrensia marina]|uniref:Replication protein C n=1 Tax=Ahrensia marina TaxID=1514904 RepID=A0A0M9GLJ9_9HYPH|nr:plasmid replication protein RepC [Ahrensia marina]KPB00667.1 replication protein C [Ahrensia marina]